MTRLSAGTNSFTVTDPEALQQALGHAVEVHVSDRADRVELEPLTADGDWPGTVVAADGQPVDFVERVRQFLAGDSVAIFYRCGYDAQLGLPVGEAWAVNRRGERCQLDLRGISALAGELGDAVPLG